MKTLDLSGILDEIDTESIRGSTGVLVGNVVTTPEKIEDNTLYFDMYRKSIADPQMISGHTGVVIVTKRPDYFNAIENVTVVKVPDATKAYWSFIDYYRSLFSLPVIGVTGTCGKTTVKEMIRHLLMCKYDNVLATHKSDNSLKMLLPYLLSMDDRTKAAVFEIGVSWPGDLKTGCRHFQPGIRLLLNIGVNHLIGCKTMEAYITAKSEIITGLDPDNGVLILNSDDKNIKKIDFSPFRKVFWFGSHPRADFRAVGIVCKKGGSAFTLFHQSREIPVYVPGLGRHNVYNALGALAASYFAGVDIYKAVAGLATFKQMEEHLEPRPGRGGCLVIDDTWNNSPPSMAAALEVLKDHYSSQRKIAVLGYMAQLGGGEQSLGQYREIGEKVAREGIDVLLAVGEEAREIGVKALECGMEKASVHFCRSGDEVFQTLLPYLNNETVILLKITHRVMTQPSFTKMKENLITCGPLQ